MNRDYITKISTQIDNAQITCANLSNLLDAEKSALIAGDMAAIKQLTDEKIALISELTLQDTELKSLLSPISVTTNTQFIKNWERLQSILQTCKYKSSINGAMINISLKHTADALSLIRGGVNLDKSTYSQNGNTNRSIHSKKIATI